MGHFVVNGISASASRTANDVFEVFHHLIAVDRDITGHDLWVLAYEIVYPSVDRALLVEE